MTDPLRAALTAAPPEFPPLDPGRIRSRARHRRTAGVAAVAVLAGGAIAVPRLVLDPAPASGPTAAPPATAPASAPTTAATTAPGRPCPTPVPPGKQHTIIDYADVVRLDGRVYMGVYPVPRTSPGLRAGVVRCTISEVGRPDYLLRDGDATFLRPGTVLYADRDLPTSFRLLADNGTVYEYRPENPRTGADLLPLAGRVTGIDVVAKGRPTRRVADPAAVLAGVLAAPVRPGADHRTPTRQLVFRLRGGSTVVRAWDEELRVIEGGIVLPPAVAALIP